MITIADTMLQLIPIVDIFSYFFLITTQVGRRQLKLPWKPWTSDIKVPSLSEEMANYGIVSSMTNQLRRVLAIQ